MSKESIHNDLLFRFVLGTVSEAEQMHVEEAWFTDPARQQELWAVFDEVAERFWQDELSPNEAQQFATRLRSSPLLYERAQQMQAVLVTLPSPATMPAVQPAPSLWSRWWDVTWWQVGLTATASVLVIVGVAWWQHTPSAPVSVARQSTPAPPPTADTSTPVPIPSPVPSTTPKPQVTPTTKPASSAPTVATFFLMNTGVRDVDSAVPLPVTSQTRTLALQMELRQPLYPRYQATVQSSDGRTHAFSNLRPQLRQGHWLLTIQVPIATVAEKPFTVQINGVPTHQEPIPVGTHILQAQKG